jgi:tetratricopeptide (TPR) repeat protein
MKYSSIFFALVLSVLISCSSNTNSPEFIKKTTGSYLYNPDEIIEVYFENEELYLKWRGATSIKPLNVGDQQFFVKEMNEKIEFSTNASTNTSFLTFVPKDKNDTIVQAFRKLDVNEKIPSEYLKNNEFDKALEGYLLIKEKDSLDASIDENNFNSLGYSELNSKNIEYAIHIFKINMELHPYSSNVYDSYADALKIKGDTLEAITFYKKSLAIDSGNKRAKKFIEKYDKKN